MEGITPESLSGNDASSIVSTAMGAEFSRRRFLKRFDARRCDLLLQRAETNRVIATTAVMTAPKAVTDNNASSMSLTIYADSTWFLFVSFLEF